MIREMQMQYDKNKAVVLKRIIKAVCDVKPEKHENLIA